MDNSQAKAERRAKEEGIEEGKIIQAVADLKDTVNIGFGLVKEEFSNVKEEFSKGNIRFNNLPCKENMKAIDTINIFIEKENKKEIKWGKRKDLLINMLIKKIIPSLAGIGLFVTAAYAYFEKIVR